MSNPQNSKYGIQNLDFLGSKFKIGYSTLTGKFQTKVGGYLTILMGLLSTGFFFVVMSQFFRKDAPIVMTSTKSGSRENSFNLYEGNLWLPIGLFLGPNVIPAKQVSRYATLKARVEIIALVPRGNGHSYKFMSHLTFDYKPCSEIDDPQMKAYVDSYLVLPGLKDSISCPDFRGLNKEFVSSISYVSLIGKRSGILVYPCSLPDPSQCASPREISVLKAEYGYPSKLLKPSDYKNPVENLIVRKMISLDPRTAKNIKELVILNKVLDETWSLVPPKLKAEYTTLRHDAVDHRMRDHTQLHCKKEEIAGTLGPCQEYLLFEYYPSEEVIVTTRSYKSLTAMLGEFGGVLKIITTAAFFVYGVYSMRKVKSVLGGIIFENGKGSEKELKDLMNTKKGIAENSIKMDKVQGKEDMKDSSKEDDFKKLVERFVSRRSNVDNLMQKLNLLEVIEKAVFKEHEKALVPLVLLKAEQSELKSEKKEGEQKVKELGDVQIFGKESTLPQLQKFSKIKIRKKQKNISKPTEQVQSSYQKSFESLINSNPDSPFSRIIKDYMVAQLQDTFSENPIQIHHGEAAVKQKFHQKPKSKNLFEKNRPQKIELFDNVASKKEGVEEIQSPEMQLVRKKKKSITGFMRPTNSPLRIRKRSTKKGTSFNLGRTSLNLKSSIIPPEDQQKNQADH